MNTFHMQASTSDTKRAMLTATDAMNGKVLALLLIFNGKDGWISRMELPKIPPILYAIKKV